MDEIWKAWTRQEGSSHYCIKSIISSDQFIIILVTVHDIRREMHVIFPMPVRAYRVAKSALRQDVFGIIDKKSESPASWPLYQVVNSSYMYWLIEESLTMIEGLNVKHLAIVTNNFVVDIATSVEPTIEFISFP